MALTMEDARELVESIFDFDHVGSAMLAVRKNFDSLEAQETLVEDLVAAATEEMDDASPENMALLNEAAKIRVQEFVKGAKFSQSGCSGL